jgi:hypothetical protein
MPDPQVLRARCILKLLAGFLRGILRFLVRVLGSLMRFERILHGLLGVFVSGEVIFFVMMHRGSAVRVSGLFVKFGGALMRIVWHDESFLAQANWLCSQILAFKHAAGLYCIERSPTRARAACSANKVSGYFSL